MQVWELLEKHVAEQLPILPMHKTNKAPLVESNFLPQLLHGDHSGDRLWSTNLGRISERSIQNVEEQIKDVEEQIKNVEDRLEKEQDPDEKKRLWKKEEQLRKKEEQLRTKKEQLRKEKEQLREKKLLLLQSTDRIQQRRRPIAKDAYDVCYEFWELLKSKSGPMPTEKDFKRSYSRSGTEICTLQNRPVLLLQGLSEGHYFDASRAVLAEFDKARLGFLVDASGSGKTRTLYEICVRTGFSLYLSGVTDSGLTDSGSRDLQEVAKKLEALYPGTGEIPLDASLACFGALLVSRLFILAQCLREETAVTPLAWLFKQVYFRHLNYAVVDPWLHLTSRLLSLIRTPSSIGDWRHVFVDILVDLKAVTKWDGVVIIDECQQLSRLLENRFMSDTTKQLKWSLLDKAYLCLDLMGFGKRVLISGTGRKLITLQDSLSESMKNHLSYFTFTQFGDFSTPQAVESYTRGIVRDVEDFDFARIVGLYTGRYRIYVTVLEMFLRDSQQEPGLQATGYFSEKFSKLSSVMGVELGINCSIWDDVVKFFEVANQHPECVDYVTTLLLLHVYTGQPVRLAMTDMELKIVQAGIGRITTSALKPLHHRNFQPSLAFQTVEIGEPVVVRALWNFLTSTGQLQRRLLDDMGIHCSSLELEPYSAQFLLGLLRGRAPVDLIPKEYKNTVEEVYRLPLQPVTGSGPELCLKMPEDDDGTTFLSWLQQLEEILKGNHQDSFRPFLYSGEVTSFGPDMVGAFVTKSVDKLLPVLSVYQHKVTGDVDLTKALNTLDVDELFMHKKGRKPRRSVEEDAVSTFKRLVSMGGLLKWVVCVTSDLRKSKVYASAYTKVPDVHKGKRTYEQLNATKALVGIIDKNLQLMVREDQWFVDAVQYLKTGE